MTSFIGNHGLFAVFVLMTVAAVLPAASEVTMLYGGALASARSRVRSPSSGTRSSPGCTPTSRS